MRLPSSSVIFLASNAAISAGYDVYAIIFVLRAGSYLSFEY